MRVIKLLMIPLFAVSVYTPSLAFFDDLGGFEGECCNAVVTGENIWDSGVSGESIFSGGASGESIFSGGASGESIYYDSISGSSEYLNGVSADSSYWDGTSGESLFYGGSSGESLFYDSVSANSSFFDGVSADSNYFGGVTGDSLFYSGASGESLYNSPVFGSSQFNVGVTGNSNYYSGVTGNSNFYSPAQGQNTWNGSAYGNNSYYTNAGSQNIYPSQGTGYVSGGRNYGGSGGSSYQPMQQLQRVLQQQVAQQQPRYSTPVYTPSYSYPQTYSYPPAVPQVCTVNIVPTATTITKGGAVTISWSSTNASTLYLNGGIYNNTRVNSSGSYTVYPTTNTTYSIRCYTAQGQTNIASSYISVTTPINYNYCANGYTNYPVCGPTYVNNYCTNGATNYPACNNNYNYNYNYNYCTNGATNYPACNNNISVSVVNTNVVTTGNYNTGYVPYLGNDLPPVKKTYYVPKKTVTVKKAATVKKATVAKKTTGTCVCDSTQYILLAVQNVDEVLQAGKLANYRVSFKNISEEDLTNVVIRVELPEELSMNSAQHGQFSKGGRTLVIPVKTLPKGKAGSVLFATDVNGGAVTGNVILVNAYANYTVPTIVKEKVALKGEVASYVLSIVGEAVKTTLTTDTTSTNSGFWSWLPKNTLDWIIFVLVFLLFISALRFVVRGNSKA